MPMEPSDLVEPSLDRYARMVRRALDVPLALVSVVEDSRQVFPGADGLPPDLEQSRETPLSHSFCRYVVKDAQPLVITDARRDHRLHDNPAIEELQVVAYAGWPLLDHRGETIGSVCAVDSEPREWTRRDLDALQDVAAACSAELLQRELHRRAEEQAAEFAAVSASNELMLALSERLASTRTLRDISKAVEDVARERLGCLHAGMWLRDIPDPTHVVAPTDPGASGVVEPLTFVHHDETDWRQATQHAHLVVGRDNPLGESVLDGGLRSFATRHAQNRRHPHLETPQQVGETRAFVALSLDGNVYGSLALVWADERVLTEADRLAVATLRSYTAQALERALLLQERVDSALTLQNAMLTRLPRPADLQLAARYLPAAARDQVGGDWYDAVVMPDGTAHVMVGDVMGHDVTAAATMGQLRSMLRTLTWSHSSPEETPSRLVGRLDRAVLDLDLGAIATLVHARVEPAEEPGGHRTLRWSSAGHPPPLLAHPDGTVEVLWDQPGDGTNDCLLGVQPDGERRDHSCGLPPGSTLLFYTDGLVERRDEDLDESIERARGVLARHHDEPLEDLLDGVLRDLVGRDPGDDVVVLGVRLDAGPRD
jgi:serine phosphatase RsbU (regulator of sigma subunit)